MLIVKPRLRWNPLRREWLCEAADLLGWGPTMDAAYELWLTRFRRAHPL